MKKQFAALHTFTGGGEQIRFFSLFAPIVPSLQETHRSKFGSGLVMLHTQVWTHERRAPDSMLADARKWSALNEPLSAWVLAEAARRILTANPYFTPLDAGSAISLVDEYSKRRPDVTPIRQGLKDGKLDWEFLDFTVVYQANGVQVGTKFRSQKEETVNDLLAKCKRHVSVVARFSMGLRNRFKGIECMVYQPKEDLKFPPVSGSSFLTWKDLDG